MKKTETLRSLTRAGGYLGHKDRALMTKSAQSVEIQEPEWLSRMATVLEVINEGVVIADDRPRILFANSRFVEMIGIPAVELIGFDPSNFYSSQEWDFVAKQDEDKHLDEKRAIRTRCPSCLDP